MALMEIAKVALHDQDYRELAFKVRDESGKPLLQMVLNLEMLTD